mgnify:CR=1 FL=1
MASNQKWNLESFLDSLIVELDKARETLAVKAINKPLTYAVKDVNLEMQLFPSFDGKKVQLGSITDQQIRKTTKKPVTKDDVSLEVIDEIDEETRDDLRKIGVSSVNDLAEIERKNVDLEKVSKKKLNYRKLAGLLQKARRSNFPPSVRKASFSMAQEVPLLKVEGENLAIDQQYDPVAILNGQMVEILSASRSELALKVNKELIRDKENELIMACDPFTIFKVKINNP